MNDLSTKRVLLVDDEQDFREALRTTLLQRGMPRVEGAGSLAEALQRVRMEPWDLVVVDVMLPDGDGIEIVGTLLEEQPAAESIVLSAVHDIPRAVRAINLGARDYLTKPLDRDRFLTVVRSCLVEGQASDHGAEEPVEHEFVTASPRVREMFSYLARVAPLDEPVLILGPTGSGKELLARAVHNLGRNSGGRFVGVNVAAVPAELFASQLFGHKAGAFSGAHGDHPGFCGEAQAGVLFLDEVGELAMTLQAQLLRVLQEREFRPVGGSRSIPLEARLVFASNRDLEREVAEGRFREDLYHRISAFQVHVPGLDERPEDVPLLVEHFVEKLARKYSRPVRSVHPRTMAILSEVEFPGNVRQLQNVLRAALLRETTAELMPRSLPKSLIRRKRRRTPLQPLAELEREHILQVFEATNGNVSEAARVLGISRATLSRRLKVYKVGPAD